MKLKLWKILTVLFACLSLVFGVSACTTPHEHQYIGVVTMPTCTEQGYTTHTCACGDSYVDTYVDELGHEYGSWVSNENGTHTKTCTHDRSHTITENCHGGSATCTQKALCEDCGAAYGETLPHIFDQKVVSDKYLKSAATCTSKAVYYYSCKCGETDTLSFEFGEKLGHEYDSWVSNENGTHTKTCTHDRSHTITENCHGGSATCTQKALCEDCGTAYGELTTHPTEDEWSYNKTYHWHNTICTCNLQLDLSEHTIDNLGWCIVCKQSILPINGVYYKISDNGTYAEVVAYTGSSAKIKIADTYNDLPVTHIRTNAFNNANITSIEIPNSVTSISQGAFYGCSGLTEIILPFIGERTGVTENDTYQYPFGYIFGENNYTGSTETQQYYYGSSTRYTTYSTYYIPTSLKSVTITGGNFLYGAFYNCNQLTSITIPTSVTSIGISSFSGCTSLTSITVPDSVTSIGEGAFSGCYGLTEITLPFIGTKAGVTESESIQYPFGYIFGTTSYTSSTKIEQSYRLSSGNIRSATYYIPTSLKLVTITGGYIVYGAFYNCSSITNIILGNNITSSIGGKAFYNCGNLTSITIPNSVTSIGSSAFHSCYSLTSIAIPDKIISLEDSVFKNCYRLATITIPDNVTSITASAFENCSRLTSIILPDRITSIGRYAFYNCDSLTAVYYKGTINDWKYISIPSYNSELTDATRYYYSESEPTLNAEGTAYDDNYWHYDTDGKTPVIWKKEN